MSAFTARPEALATKAGRRAFARNTEVLRSQLLGLPKRASRMTAKYSPKQLVSGRSAEPWPVTALLLEAASA